MSKFPLIKAIGLDFVVPGLLPLAPVVSAEDLEKVLQDAPVGYGYVKNKDDIHILDKASIEEYGLTEDNIHQVRIVCIQPFKKKTKSEAALELLAKIHSGELDWDKSDIAKVLEMQDE